MVRFMPEEQLREEFNRWAEEGHGEAMERHHLPLLQKTLQRMRFHTADRVLELGCGEGWASRIVARVVGEQSQVVGLDISDEMIRHARAKSRDFSNLMFICASAEKIPWDENYFTKVFSIESFYYYDDQERAMGELFRVMAPLGWLYLILCIYRENPQTERWVAEANVRMHVRSAGEYREMFQRGGWLNVSAEEIKADPPAPGEEPRSHDRALLITAQKPDLMVPGRAMEIWS